MVLVRLAAAAGLALAAPVAAQISPGTLPSPAFQVIDQPNVPILNTTRYAIIEENGDIRLPRFDTLRAGHVVTIKSLVGSYCCPFIHPNGATIDYQDRRRPVDIRYLEAITLVYDGLGNWHIISRTGERPAAPRPRAAED